MLKKLGIVLLIILCMLPVSAATIKAESNIIENDETGIPDKKLYKQILHKLKKKKGEKFTKKEAESIDTLYLWFENYDVSFRGIGCLKNLKKLDCFGMDTGDLEEIAAELPHLKKLYINRFNVSDIENRKTVDSLESLRIMKDLVYLDVSYNNLSSLNGIGGMNNLKTLKAVSNQIVNAEEASGLKNLTRLEISNNQLTNLTGINRLEKVKCLDVSNNNLTSMKGIGKLKKLEKLNLSGNCLSKVNGIKKLNNLKELYLNDNKLTKVGEIGQVKNLTVLFLDRNQLTETKGIGKLKRLEILHLSSNRLTKLGDIKQLKSLKNLILSRNRFKKLSDSDLNCLKKLNYLNMNENELKKLPSKKSLKRIEYLFFSWNYLTKKEIKNKLKKEQWEGDSLCRWMWEEQKTGINITYLSPGQKSGITKDTTEIVAKITPEKIKGSPPFFYLLLPDGKTIGLEGEKFTAPKADEQGVFRIEGLDLKAYAGEEIGLVALLDYEWDIIMDWFTVQE